MQDTIIKGTGNSRTLKSVSDFKTKYPTYDSFVAALVAGTLPVDLGGLVSGGCSQVGTPVNTANLYDINTQNLITALYQNLVGSTPTAVNTPNSALFNLATVLVKEAALREALGNTIPKIVTGSYVGTGTYGASNPNTLTFDFVPRYFRIGSAVGPWFEGMGYMSTYQFIDTSKNLYTASATVTVSGKTISWYNTSNAERQCNNSGWTYVYIAIG